MGQHVTVYGCGKGAQAKEVNSLPTFAIIILRVSTVQYSTVILFYYPLRDGKILEKCHGTRCVFTGTLGNDSIIRESKAKRGKKGPERAWYKVLYKGSSQSGWLGQHVQA